MRTRKSQWWIVLTIAAIAAVATLALPQTGWARATRAARSAGHARLLQAASPATTSPSAATALAAPGAVAPRAGDCARCDGGISLLTLRYTGALPSVLVTVTQTGNAGHGEGQPQPIPVFSGTVPRGGTFTLAGQDKHGTLGASITIDVNGALDATVGTDCRTPVGPGLVAGDFTVVDGVSREGSRLCPVVPPPPVPVLQAALTYQLLIDADNSHDVSAGDTLRYSAVIANPGPVDVTGAVFHDAPALPARLVAGSVTTTQGTVAAGNTSGDSTATVSLGTVPKGGSVTVTFDVRVLPLPAGTIALANQGFASGDGLPGVPTDDPGTPEVDDPTHAVAGTRPLLHALLTVRDRDRGHEGGGGGGDEPGRPGRADAGMDPGVKAGDLLHYTATIQNRGNAPATGVAFLDALAASLHLRTDSVTTSQGTVVTGRHEGDTSVAVALGTIAPGGAATIQFDVRIDRRLPAGTRAVANQGTVTSAQSPGGEGTDDPATPAVDDATVSPLTGQTLLAAVKYATLLTNLKGDGRAGPGDVVRYLVLAANRGGQEATGVRFADAPDPNSPLVVGTAATSLGAVTAGNTAGDSVVNVDVGPLAAGQGVAVAFDAAVSTQLPMQAQALSNQGAVTADGQSPLPTDDPTTPAAGDPTVTPLAFTAAIGDFVWNDLNGNGIQDAGEPGLAGVAVQLLDGNGNPLAATTSDAGGAYRFANLPPGTYVVQFTAPPGLAFSPKRQGNDPTRSSAADPQTGRSDPVLLNRYDNLTVDAGFTQHFVVGRRVWEDLNGNGIQDPGEPGIGGVTVHLLDGTGAVMQTATSGADGSYGFTGMVPGTYYVEFVPPAGFVFTLKGQGADPTLASAADPASGDTGPLVLTPGVTNLTANAGLYRPVVLSGFVWDDANGNGFQDRTEQGRAGVDVDLLDPTGKVLQTAFTDPGGAYRFAGLAPGSYAIRVQRASGLTFSPRGQGGDPAKDSDVDPATGMTPATTFASGGSQAADAGLFQAVSGLTTSPVNGEQDVAVDRPLVLRLSGPLAPSAVVDGTKVSVAFGGSVVPLRVHLSPDRRVVTLFHDQPFPASARMRLTVVGDGLPNVFGNDLDADGDGKPGGVALVDFNTLNLTTVPNTVVCGTIYASQLDTSGPGDTSKNTPLTGVTISVQGAPALGTMTDANGNFCLSPAPAGRFFVLVDGHTATNGVPPGNYYPSVGKAWVSIPGQQVSIGEVYLPLIPSGTLQPVSQTADTAITFAPSVTASFPQFAGMRVTIPADSLYSNDGSRGGMVGIAPVPPDRLPAPLPPGLHFPLVITVQTNGPDNFDVPAPVCFPNLTDQTTGITLAPGSKSALWSFNHHTGNFEIVGPMTVSADGKTVCTDPGVGIVGPSWHGTQPGTGPSPMPAPKMPKPKDKCDNLDLVSKAASLAKDIVTGAARFSPFLQKIQCAVSAVSTAAGLINDFRNAASQNSILCGALIDLKVRFNQVTDLLDKCLPGPEEITAAQQACMDLMNAVSALKDLTAFGSCTDSEVLQLVAEIVSDAATAANTVITLKQQALGLIDPRKALDQLLALLVEKVSEKACPGNRAGNRPGAAGAAASPADVPVDPATAALLNMIADNLTTETTSAGQLQPPVISDFMAKQAAAVTANDTFLRGFVDGLSQPIANPVYVSITTGTFVQRFRTEGTFQAILPPNAEVKVAIYDPLSKYVDVETTRTNDSGQLTRFGEWVLTPELNPVDSDNDGLSDLAESIVGTDPHNPDTDGKGIGDAEEVLEGLFPLNGRQFTTGVIAAINIQGQAVDICAVNNVAMVAAEGGGLIVFNVFSGTNPVILAQVATPAPAVSVACAGNLAAVATGAGLSIVDLTDPPAAKIVHQVALPAGAQRVAAAGGLAYVASGTQVVLVDLTSGTVLDTLSYSQNPIHDFSVAGDFVYLLTATGGVEGSHTIYKVPIDVTLDPPAATLRISGQDHPTFGRMHIFAGGGLIYVGSADDNASNQAPGVEIIRDDGNVLTLIGPPSPITAFDVAVNGSGLALFTGADPGLTGSAKVGVLDVRDPTVTSSFLTAYGLPGPAQEIAIYDATGYVADGGGGLQVINYQPYDTQGVPPTISLSTNFSPGVASEGALMRVTANVQDDVQVRNVEFFVDGVRVLNNGTFPFELRFTTPLIAQQPSLALHACAWDTGGNHTCTPETTITLVPDASPPRVTAAAPAGNVAGNPITAVAATFNKLIDPATLTAASFQLISAGPDGVLGTADDVAVGGGVTSFRPAIATGFLTFASPLAPGLYQGVVTGVVDLAGNQMAAPFSWTFTILPPPSVAIDSPADGSTVIQGSSLVITVTAVGPVPILSVDFLVDGVVARTAFSPPYRATVLVPATATSLTLGATANFTGKLSVQAVPVVVQAMPDPGTTVVGRVVDQGSNPVAGATVTIVFNPSSGGVSAPEVGTGPGPNPGTFTGVSQSDGTFSIPGVPTIAGVIGADASAPVAGSATYLVGSAIPKSPVVGGTTDLGTFTLKPNAACYTAVLTFSNCSTGPVTGTLTLQDSMGRTSQVTADATGRFCAIVDTGLQYFLRRQEDVICTNNSVQHVCTSSPFQLSDPGTTGQCGGVTCEDHGTLNFFCASS
jgi:uncharacterized repeat protein (TIGR01451 family)